MSLLSFREMLFFAVGANSDEDYFEMELARGKLSPPERFPGTPATHRGSQSTCD